MQISEAAADDFRDRPTLPKLILEGKFSGEICLQAFKTPDHASFFRRIGNRLELTSLQQQRLLAECEIWRSGYGSGNQNELGLRQEEQRR